jgi:erythromycin esterase-like protein
MARNRQVKICVEPAVAEGFRLVCAADGVSMARELSRFMEQRAGVKSASTARLQTRHHRRETVRNVIGLLRAVAQAEEDYRDRIPENLQGGAMYESADAAVGLIDDAVSALEEAFGL